MNVKSYFIDGVNLSDIQIEKMEELYLSNNPQMPENHIRKNHINLTNPVFHLFEIDGEIIAFQAYSVFKLPTPFSKKEIPVVYINLSYKSKNENELVKNFAKKSNLEFIKRTFGSLWFFKSFVMLFQTYNPKLVQRISTNFHKSYPNINSVSDADVVLFGKKVFKKILKINPDWLDENLIKHDSYPQLSEIMDWDNNYKASDSKFNHFFMQNKVVVEKDGKYFLSGRAVFFIGYYNFRRLLTRK